MGRQPASALLLVVILMIALANGSAATPPALGESWRRCTDGNADASIGGCTEIVKSGAATSASLAVAFYNRGIAQRHAGRFDRAIQDYGQAIRLQRNDAEALNNRGIAY